MKIPTKRATRCLAASLVIITALATVQTAQAATPIYYKGGTGSESNPINFLLKDYWTGNSSYSGGSISQYPEGQHDMNFGFAEGANNTAYVYSTKSGTETKKCANYMKFHTGHFIFTSGNFECGSTFYLGATASETSTVTKKAGVWTLDGEVRVGDSGSGTLVQDDGSILVGNALYVGYSGAGTLTINDGTIEVASGSQTFPGWNSGSSGTINLNGGVFKTKRIACNSGRAYLNFNGGTLMANAAHDSNQQFIKAENMTVTVGAGGGTIDNGGHNITIAANIGGTGGMIFTGAGKTTLNNAADYTGQTSVAPGTTLVVYRNDMKNTILDKGLVVVGVPNVGDEIFIVTRGPEYTISAEQLAKVTCPLAPTTTFELGEGNTNIVVATVGPTLDNYWTGAANDGDLSNSANWKSGVPTTGNANIFCVTPATLTKGATFAPSSITFLAGSAKVTIDGDAITDITAITNLSSARHVFNCAVSGNEIDFCNTSQCCEFWGGITLASAIFTGTASDTAKGLVGKWHFTGNWTPVSNNRIYGNSSVTVDGELLNSNSMSIDSGAVVTAATMKATMSSNACSAYDNSGRLVITGMMDIQTTTDFSLARQGTQDATIIVGGIVYNTGNWPWLNAKTLVLGEDGINFDSSHNNNLRFGATPTLYARGAATTLHAGKNDLQAYSIKDGDTLTVCTTQFDSSEPSTITIDGKILGTYNVTLHYTGGMAVTGNGKLVFNSESTFTGGLTVGDTATVQVNAGCTPGTGTVTLGAGTKLALTATSKEFSLANTLNLPTGENEVATIRIDGARLRSGDHEIATVGNAATTANVALDPASDALGGRKSSLRVEDGKLKLNIEPTGLMVIFR